MKNINKHVTFLPPLSATAYNPSRRRIKSNKKSRATLIMDSPIFKRNRIIVPSAIFTEPINTDNELEREKWVDVRVENESKTIQLLRRMQSSRAYRARTRAVIYPSGSRNLEPRWPT